MDGLVENELIFEVSGKRYTAPDLLRYWIEEREVIRALKEAGEPKPWSDDWVFQNTYFTNVHREDDKVTKWIRKVFNTGAFGKNLELAMVAARIFNHPESLAFILQRLNPFDPGNLTSDLKFLQNHKKQIWGGAYLITTHGQKMTKIDYCVRLLDEANRVLPRFEDGPLPVNSITCEGWHQHLMTIDGLGNFLAAQVVADLKHTKGHPLMFADDWYTFSAPGPGSLRGLAWFHGVDRVSPSDYHAAIRIVKSHVRWGGDMQDLQNCLCEFDKYCRVLTGKGRSKRKYPGKE